MLIREEAAISFLEESERPRRGLINLPIDCAKHMNRADAMFVSFDACAYYKLNALMLRGNMFLSICFSCGA